MFDSIIIGAGPAGLFAANELKGYKVLVIDKGKDLEDRECPIGSSGVCTKCKVCSIMHGVGGAGVFSDGTLNLRPDKGNNLIDITSDEKEAWDLVKYVDSIFLECGAPEEISGDNDQIVEMGRKAAAVGARFVRIPQRHIGTDGAAMVIQKFVSKLKNNGTEFLSNREVKDMIIEGGKCSGVILDDGETILGK